MRRDFEYIECSDSGSIQHVIELDNEIGFSPFEYFTYFFSGADLAAKPVLSYRPLSGFDTLRR
jgi:hypothetical protein